MPTTRTKVVNQTGRSIRLQEGTANVYRTLCDNLQPGKPFIIKVDPNATYRDYKLAVPLDDERHVVLSSDVCMEYEEVRIKLKEDGTTYTWDAVMRSSHELVKDAGDVEASNPNPAQSSSPTPGPSPGFFGKAWNKFRGWFS